jgi:hypothetical protein
MRAVKEAGAGAATIDGEGLADAAAAVSEDGLYVSLARRR